MRQLLEEMQKHGGQNCNTFVASPNSVRDPDWYFDSGTSNHVTHDSNHLQEFSDHDARPI